MATPDLSTRAMRAFLTLAELRNFTRAAQATHLSQPAFSALIRSLEDAVGARLFDRNTRNVQLTPEGRLFEPSARQLLADTARALGDLADHVERRKGHVHVAALPSLAAGWLPALFADYRAAWPGVTLALSDLLSDACIDLVRGGRADFALAAAGLRAADSAGLHTRVLGTDRFHLVCRADHLLASEARLTLRKLAPWPFIHMTRNSSVRQALEAALHPLQMNTLLEVEQLATVMGMVEAGLGISVVPTLTLYQFRRETIATRALPLPQLRRRILLVRRREGSLSAAAQALHDMVVQRFDAPPQAQAGRKRRAQG
ncbi:LysR family transcriptional regulator [Xenophilus azovorans]|uniref:LysR family transcriptional regulator n=1 Tax=Xenophilus azovorans TaxID=151755 RepID=UPI00056ED083|nr:LysR family transcriptional regulator [Xenophilus azovorans]